MCFEVDDCSDESCHSDFFVECVYGECTCTHRKWFTSGTEHRVLDVNGLHVLINKVADFALSRLLYTFTLPPFSFEAFLYTFPL